MSNDRVERAWRMLVQRVKDYEAKPENGTHERARFRATLGLAIGVTKKTIDTWIENPGLVFQKKVDDPHVAAIVTVYKNVARQNSPDWQLAGATAGHLGLSSDDFRKLSSYSGRYRCFRLGKEDEFIEGDIVIDNSDGATPWIHEHTSKQNLGDKDRPQFESFDHRGPVFPVGQRLYFLAVGNNDKEIYFRTMIITGADKPKANILMGIVLTEVADTLKPFASPIAVVSYDHAQFGTEPQRVRIKDMLLKAGANIKTID
jgi:hypothetical protein